MMTMDTRVKTYKNVADFNKDQKLMARIGWAVTNTTTFQGKLTVNYQREVTAEHPATSAHAGAFAEHLQEQTERMNMRVANEKMLRKTGGSWLQRLEALMKPK